MNKFNMTCNQSIGYRAYVLIIFPLHYVNHTCIKYHIALLDDNVFTGIVT
jgi:hypothetical protein